MTNILEWIKNAYVTVKNYFEANLLMFLLISSFVIITVFFIVARICTSGNYYAKLGKKFKRLNIIIRENQINEDREKFLNSFNKQVKKKNKKFASAWNSYILDDGQEASLIFKNTKFDQGKKGFFNFFLIFSWVVPVCLIALFLSFKKFSLDSTESLYVVVFIPIFIIVLGILFNLIYISVRNKQRKDMLKHLEFFTQNIDGAVKGFQKADFELCGINKIDTSKTEDINVLEYENYLRSNELDEVKDKAIIDLIHTSLAEDKTNKALSLAREIEQKNLNVDIEQKLHDDEKVIQLENENKIDESKEKLLSNLKRLKNLEIMTDENQVDKDHPFDDVDAEKKLEIEKEVKEVASAKKAELNKTRKGKKLQVLEATPVGRKKLVKKPVNKKSDAIALALANLENAKTTSNLTKVASESKTKKAEEVKKETPAKKQPAKQVKKAEPKKAEKPKVAPVKAQVKTEAKQKVIPTKAEVKAQKQADKKTSVKKAEEKKPAEAKQKEQKQATAKKPAKKKEPAKVDEKKPEVKAPVKKVEAKANTPKVEVKTEAPRAEVKKENSADKKQAARQQPKEEAKKPESKKVTTSVKPASASKKTEANKQAKNKEVTPTEKPKADKKPAPKKKAENNKIKPAEVKKVAKVQPETKKEAEAKPKTEAKVEEPKGKLESFLAQSKPNKK